MKEKKKNKGFGWWIFFLFLILLLGTAILIAGAKMEREPFYLFESIVTSFSGKLMA
ncbi:MAG: hypothetical protein GX786_00725 [Clostridiales bacterium]|nr:hypothetical protein [Clostridiales bacterium]